MLEQDPIRIGQPGSPVACVGLYLNPVTERRVQFQAVCTGLFARLYVAESAQQAQLFLKQHAIDTLIIDLHRFDQGFDLFALRELVANRAGAPTLLICPFTHAGWLPDLMSAGPVQYAISPLLDEQLRDVIEGCFVHHGGGAGSAANVNLNAIASLRSLLSASERVQQAVAIADELETMAARICEALAGLPGVVHASLFQLREAGELELEAQHSGSGLNLRRLLGLGASGALPLAQSPLRHAFPGLLAALSPDIALLDDPAKAGDPELAIGLVEAGVGMVLAVPLPAPRCGHQGGSLCLMFERARPFSADEMAAFMHLAQLAGFGLHMGALQRENALLQVRLAHLATTDALTNACNRRHGEQLLELEARRARRYQLPLALLVFDIDRLKAVNDQFGHAVGDAVIATVADVVRAELRASDVLVRSGGGEFLIIAPHTSAIDALKIAEKIRLTVAATDMAGCDQVTTSLGVGQLTSEEAPDALAVRVNKALARAKRAGRNCIELAMA